VGVVGDILLVAVVGLSLERKLMDERRFLMVEVRWGGTVGLSESVGFVSVLEVGREIIMFKSK
jgi:hypothetical protein